MFQVFHILQLSTGDSCLEILLTKNFFLHIQNSPYLLKRRVDTSFWITGTKKNKMHLK
jgi:hypothetical protein